jgi:phospholipid N-methyltransferase
VIADARRTKGRASDRWLFFTKFLRHGTAIASFVPSSRSLSRAFLRGIDFSTARVIVELGAGTGPVTEALLEAAPASCRCLILERDRDFCARLRERFPNAEIVEADAADLEKLLDERGIAKVDHFLCGLPLPSFPRALRDKVLGVVGRRMSETGTFRQLTHMPWVYSRMYRGYFAEVRFRFVLRNLPPGGYYVCRGWKRTEG